MKPHNHMSLAGIAAVAAIMGSLLSGCLTVKEVRIGRDQLVQPEGLEGEFNEVSFKGEHKGSATISRQSDGTFLYVSADSKGKSFRLPFSVIAFGDGYLGVIQPGAIPTAEDRYVILLLTRTDSGWSYQNFRAHGPKTAALKSIAEKHGLGLTIQGSSIDSKNTADAGDLVDFFREAGAASALMLSNPQYLVRGNAATISSGDQRVRQEDRPSRGGSEGLAQRPSSQPDTSGISGKIRSAVEANLDRINKQYESLAGNKPNKNNPWESLLAMTGALVQGTKLELTSFRLEKAWRRSDGRVQAVYWYSLKDSGESTMGGMVSGLTSGKKFGVFSWVGDRLVLETENPMKGDKVVYPQ